jgi:hypothetical protein
MQSRTSTHAPTLPRAVLHILGNGLKGFYADLLEQPVPAPMMDTLARSCEVPHLLPDLRGWTHTRVRDARTVGHRPVVGL